MTFGFALLICVLVIIFKDTIMSIVKPVEKVYSKSLNIADVYLSEVEKDIKVSSKLSRLEKRTKHEQKLEDLKKQYPNLDLSEFTLDDLELDK